MNTEDYIEDAFLTIHYEDRRDRLETWRVYANNGQVRIFDGQSWRSDYTLSPDEIRQIQQAIESAGILHEQDIAAGDVHDAATLTWAWTLPDGRAGQLQNRAYPAKKHHTTDQVMTLLLDLEDQYLDEDVEE